MSSVVSSQISASPDSALKTSSAACWRLLVAIALASIIPLSASADYSSYEEAGWGVNLGFGLTASPTNFLIDIGVPYSVGSGVSIGPRVQVGLSENRNYVAPTLAFEYSHDLSRQVDGTLGKIRPIVHGGLGFAWLEEDNRPGKDSDVGFLMDVGFGAEYPLSENFGIASVVDFNILPKKTLDENFVWSWQVLQLRFRF